MSSSILTPLWDGGAREWQVPDSSASESRKIGWINEHCQDGESWHKSQRGYDDWLKGLEIIAGQSGQKDLLAYRSNLTSNRLKVNILTSIAGLAAIRPWGGYQAQGGFKAHALFMNLTTRALYLNGAWDQSIKEALQWAAVTNTGWLRPVYRRNMAGHGHGNIELDSFGMPSVLVSQMPADGNWQNAYAGTVLDEKPIWMAHGMFPDYQDKLKPTSSRYWYNAQIRKAAVSNNARRGWWSPFRRKDQNDLPDNLIPLRYTTINDLAVNTTGKTIMMGAPGSPWSYEVPSFNEEFREVDGKPVKATMMDARMYPFRRLIISSENCVPYDGPAFNWHGEWDMIPFCLDKWPWEPMGFNMVHDGYKISKGIDAIDRGVMDKINADLDRGLAYNLNAVSKREANQVDIMQPRLRIAFDGDAVDKPFVGIAPEEVYKVSAETLAFRKELQADLDYTLQTRDIVELSKARALGKGMDQLEALVNANGPRVKDMSRGMEVSVGGAVGKTIGLAGQIKFLVLQYLDTGRLIPFTTEAGLNSIFDYDPASLIPSHLPGEDTVDANNQALPSPTPRVARARWFAQNLTYTMLPHSIHEIHQMTYRLMQMQMKQRGAPMPWCDIMEANDVPDVKHVAGSTVQERYWTEQEEELEHALKVAKMAQAEGVDPAALGGSKGGKKPEGRPPSGQQAPQQKSKGDGRPVISESG